MSYYSMQAHLTANLLVVWLLLKPTPRRAFCAGVFRPARSGNAQSVSAYAVCRTVDHCPRALEGPAAILFLLILEVIYR